MNNENENNVSLRIRDLQSDERPREKALANGIASLTDTELIAILLSTGMQGKSVVSMSQEILAKYDNSLAQLSHAGMYRLANSVKGMGKAKAVTLAAAIELGTRCCRAIEKQHRTKVSHSQIVFDEMRQRLERLDVEQFWLLCLNQSNCIESKMCISQGGMSATVVDSKVVLKNALDRMASGIIVVHNHPSGNLNPSIQDDKLTRKLRDGATLLDIRLLDHIIISHNGYYSYSDHNRLESL